MPGFRYRAFLSYSHIDRAVAKKIHRQLERYVLPAALRRVGTNARWDRRPLRPIYRDEDESLATADLPARIREALAASEYLIVLCTPAAARSEWVEREITHFQSLGRQERILAIVTAGEPNAVSKGCAPQLECLPQALRNPYGEPLWADMRQSRAGPVNFLRIVAALLNLDSLDTLVRREQKAQKWRLIRNVILAAGSIVLLGGLCGALAIRDRDQRRVQSIALADLAHDASERGLESRAARLATAGVRLGASGWLVFDPTDAQAELLRISLSGQIPAHVEAAEPIEKIVLSADGRRLETLSESGTARLWDLGKPGTPLRSLTGVRDVDISANGILAVLDSNQVHLLDAKNGLDRGRLVLPEGGAGTVRFSLDGSKIAVIGKQLEIWDAATARREATHYDPPANERDLINFDYAIDVVFSTRHQRLTLTDHYDVISWNLGTGRRTIKSIDEIHEGECSERPADSDMRLRRDIELPAWIVALGASGRRWLGGYLDCKGRVWDVESGRIAAPIFKQEDLVWGGAFSPDERRLVTTSYNLAWIWDVAQGMKIGAPLTHASPVTHVMYAVDGRHILTRTDDGALHLWGTNSTTRPASYRDLDGLILPTLSSDSGTLAAVAGESKVKIWFLTGGTAPTAATTMLKEAIAAAAPATNRGLMIDYCIIDAAGAGDVSYDARGPCDAKSGVRLVDLSRGANVGRPLATAGVILGYAFSPDGRVLAVSMAGASLRLWDARTGRELAQVESGPSPMIALQFSADSASLLTLAADGTRRRWNSGNGQLQSGASTDDLPTGVRAPTSAKRQGDMSEDGEAQSVIAVRDLVSVKESIIKIEKRKNEVFVALARDGSRALVATQLLDVYSNSARLYDAARGAFLPAAIHHNHALHSAIFSPDGTSLLSIDSTGQAYLWDTATANLRRELTAGGTRFRSGVFANNGRFMATADALGHAIVWDVKSGRQLLSLDIRQGDPIELAFAPDSRQLITRSSGGSKIWTFNARLASLGGPALVHEMCKTLSARGGLRFEPEELAAAPFLAEHFGDSACSRK